MDTSKLQSHVQYATPEDTSTRLPPDDAKIVQEVTGTFLYYRRNVDPTILTAISDIATYQSQTTAQTMTDSINLLDYAATHPEATIRYKISGMVLQIHTDALYLSVPKARSQ